MKRSKTSAVWNELRELGYNASARMLDSGTLAGEHVVEVEPGPALTTADFTTLMGIAATRGLELSYGLSPRRVLVLS